MPSPPAETVSSEEFLSRLDFLLTTQLPSGDSKNSQYKNFCHSAWIPRFKTRCEVATLGEHLGHIFGWKAHTWHL